MLRVSQGVARSVTAFDLIKPLYSSERENLSVASLRSAKQGPRLRAGQSPSPGLPLIDASDDRELFDELCPQGRPSDRGGLLINHPETPSSIVNCIRPGRGR